MGRFALAFALPMIAVFAIAISLINGVLAANLSLGGVPMQLKVPELRGKGLGMFGNAASVTGGDKQVATTGIGDATIIGGMCRTSAWIA